MVGHGGLSLVTLVFLMLWGGASVVAEHGHPVVAEHGHPGSWAGQLWPGGLGFPGQVGSYFPHLTQAYPSGLHGKA